MGTLEDITVRGWIKRGEHFELKSDGDNLYLRFRKSIPASEGRKAVKGDAVPRWLYRYRINGKSRVIHLGKYKVQGSNTGMSIADARKMATELRARVTLGYDPQGEKKERKEAVVAKIEADKLLVTLGQVADGFYSAQILGRWKNAEMIKGRIEKDIKPHLGRLLIGEVKPQHIDVMLQAIIKRGSPTMANDMLRWVKKIFDYAMKRQLCQSNPAAPYTMTDAGGHEESRDRWLTRAELVKLLEALKMSNEAAIENALSIKLLLMTAVRRRELTEAKVTEFDLDAGIWYLPAERTKTKAAIDIPLPRQAIALLRQLVLMGNGSKWLLPARKAHGESTHISPDTIGAWLVKTVRPMLESVPDFTVHDLRRTAKTQLAALKIPDNISEKCLNHKVKGVAGVYDRHDYFDERKEALQKWADVLDQCEKGGAEVIELRPAKTV